MVIELEEMDWRAAKKIAEGELRKALLSIKLNTIMLDEINKELDLIIAKMPKKERDKRLKD